MATAFDRFKLLFAGLIGILIRLLSCISETISGGSPKLSLPNNIVVPGLYFGKVYGTDPSDIAP